MSFTARYRGECAQCDDPITPGQEVEYDWEHDLIHVVCPDQKNAEGKPLAVCPQCFMAIPVSGVCGVCE